MNTSAIISKMFDKDFFSQWLRIERVEETLGYCKLRMTIREEMCNGFGIAHGGISYSLADSALAFASNTHGRHAVSIDTSMSHLKPLYPNDIIFAIAEQKSISNRIAVYEVRIEKENKELVALMKGTVYIKDKQWS